MNIGLTEIELLLTLQNSFKNTEKQFNANKMTAEVGINPEANVLFNQWQEQMPDIAFEMKAVIFSLLMAFAETISKNNESLAKSIHSDG